MILERIKEKLIKEGYEITLRPLKGIGNCIQGGIPKENENSSLDAYFRVLIVKDKIYLDFISQIENNKYFDSEDDLIDFIKQKYSLG